VRAGAPRASAGAGAIETQAGTKGGVELLCVCAAAVARGSAEREREEATGPREQHTPSSPAAAERAHTHEHASQLSSTHSYRTLTARRARRLGVSGAP
jgi:hypothetical protein